MRQSGCDEKHNLNLTAVYIEIAVATVVILLLNLIIIIGNYRKIIESCWNRAGGFFCLFVFYFCGLRMSF